MIIFQICGFIVVFALINHWAYKYNNNWKEYERKRKVRK